jgi:hypothetical protein
MSLAIESSDELEELRTRLRKMTDAQLVNFGKAARSLCRDRNVPTRSSASWKKRVESGGTGTRRSSDKTVRSVARGTSPVT